MKVCPSCKATCGDVKFCDNCGADLRQYRPKSAPATPPPAKTPLLKRLFGRGKAKPKPAPAPPAPAPSPAVPANLMDIAKHFAGFRVEKNSDGVTYTLRGITQADMQRAVIPDGVTVIGEGAFKNCHKLTEIVLPDGLSIIGKESFAGCTNLRSVTFPKGLTYIGDYAFTNCYCLSSSIVLQDGLTTICRGAFYNCGRITSVTIPESVTDIGQYAFRCCRSLTEVYAPPRFMDSFLNIN
jgi:hypothetical protein